MAEPPSRAGSSANVVHANTTVHTIEDEFQDSLQLGNLSITGNELPQRPAYGRQGSHLVIRTNYGELELNREQPTLLKDSIEVQPTAKAHRLHRVIKLLLNQQPPGPQGDYFTDYKSTIILRAPGPDHMAFNVRFFHEDEDGPTDQSGVYHIRLDETNKLSVADLIKHIDPRNGVAYDTESMVQVLNIMLQHYSRSRPDCVTVGKNTFPLSGDAVETKSLGSGLQASRGFFASVRLGTGRVLVNVNVAYNVFYQPGSLHDLIDAFGYRNKEQLDTFLKFLRIKKMHLEHMKSDGTVDAPTGTIWGLAKPGDGTTGAHGERLPNPPMVRYFGAGPNDIKFWNGLKGYITVFDHFKALGFTPKHPEFPVVNTGSSTKPVYLPPEFCSVPIGQHASMRRVTLTGDQTTIMLKMALKKPAENFKLILDHGLTVTGLKRTTGLLDDRYARFLPRVLGVNARVLSAPKVMCVKEVKVGNARWNLANHKFNQPGQPVKSWTWLLLTVSGHETIKQPSTSMKRFADAFKKALVTTGLKIASASPGSQSDLKDESDGRLEQILTCASKDMDLLWIIVPKNVKLLYNRIKLFADVKLGVTTVCSQDWKLQAPGLSQYFGNEALKVNLKLGGRNQVVDPKRLFFIQGNDTMVVGIDVTHPSTDLKRGGAPSIAAMVASVDQYLSQWLAEISIQATRQERVSDLKNMMKTRLEVWRKRHGQYPSRILVYRDGVSEGQYKMVKNEEQPMLEKACQELYQPVNQGRPDMTIIIVTKRHHTRFAPASPAGADSTGNCPAGTIVDRGITSPTLWQFFLQPHSTLHGSARSGFHTVIMDGIFRKTARDPRAGGLNAQEICETVTQSLCYTFGRATGAVGIATPAYYADIVCTRAAAYLHAIAASSLVPDYLQAHRGASEIDQNRCKELQVLVNTHEKLKETMFFI